MNWDQMLSQYINLARGSHCQRVLLILVLPQRQSLMEVGVNWAVHIAQPGGNLLAEKLEAVAVAVVPAEIVVEIVQQVQVRIVRGVTESVQGHRASVDRLDRRYW